MLWSHDIAVSLSVLFSQETRSSISRSFMLELTCREGKVEGDRGNEDAFSYKENRIFAVLLPPCFFSTIPQIYEVKSDQRIIPFTCQRHCSSVRWPEQLLL